MQYSQEHLKTMVYAEFGGQTESIMGHSKIENVYRLYPRPPTHACERIFLPLLKTVIRLRDSRFG